MRLTCVSKALQPAFPITYNHTDSITHAHTDTNP
jgi:hypothetical protein